MKPEVFYEGGGEVDERVRADGTVEKEPDLAAVRAELSAALAAGIKAVAIVFMHAYRYCEHEQRVAALAREIGFPQVSVSHEVSPLIKLVGRGDTTVVDAYLSPILQRYVAQVAHDMGATGAATGDALASDSRGHSPSPTLPPKRGREPAAATGASRRHKTPRSLFMSA